MHYYLRRSHKYPHLYHRLASTTRVIPKEPLISAGYKPELVEKNKYDKWEKSGLFTAESCSEAPRFSVVLPPPNVTGKLHLGHALACTIQDVIVRRQRALGRNVLWLPGTDHAGIATQGIVEKYLKSTQNLTRHDIGREKFNDEVWKWRQKHGSTITEQLRALGCSLDWSRERFTMDAGHIHAVNEAFIQLFNRGLIYRQKALVNWSPSLKSTVSDIEVDHISLTGPTDIPINGYSKPVRFGQLYSFAYKIYNSNEELVVSTTMPETMLGDVAVAVHPDDQRYLHLKNQRVLHPFRKQAIPIIYDEFVDMKFGTGAVKITPAHSRVDFEIGKLHRLPLLQVFDEDGKVQNCEEFNNMKKYDSRDIIVQKLKDLGLLKGITSHEMTLPTCSRTGDVIEYLPKEQWFLSCTEMNDKARKDVSTGRLTIEPEKYVKNWFQWTDNDRDWCISRQIWWGHQIPAYKCSVDQNVVWVADTDDIAAKTQASQYLRAPPDMITVERDTDVLDTWFSSGIYPFAALGWPTDSPDLKFYPLDLMATGHDILGFWVHRMVMLGLELTGKLPFNKVLLHGIVCDSKGAKMSKSRGNVIDPVDVIKGITLDQLANKTKNAHKEGLLNKEELVKALAYHKSTFSNTNGIPECGVDALRFTLLSQDIKSHFVNFDVNMCNANKLFCNKIWNSIKYMQLSFDKLKKLDVEITENDLTYFDRWILSRLAHMVATVNDAMEVYDFHLATKALRTHIYNEFCDIYLEATKPGFESGNPKHGYAHAHTLSAVLNTALRCLNPYMVYVTAELIPKIPAFEINVIHNFNDARKKSFDFPTTDEFLKWRNEEYENQVDRFLNAITLVRELRGFYGISNKTRPNINIKTDDETLVTDIRANKPVVLNLTRCTSVDFGGTAVENYVKGLLDENTEVYVEVVGENVDNSITEAKKKLHFKIQKLEETLATLEAKLSSDKYLTTVPEWAQVLDREKLASKKEQLKNLQRLV